MKVLSIQILAVQKPHQPPAIPVAQASDLSSFSFLQRGSIGEVAFSLLNKLLDEFTTKIPESKWKPILANPPTSGTAPNLGFNSINDYLVKYQDPKQADTILKVQQELDETKIVLHKTIESVLERGEKLDSLVERSNALSSQSKMFYKTAKKQNSCCLIV
ncbi:hypothetical protein MJO28_013440 [Puccinia striiformis f. sp. tritici]|uniref:Uncharacterized protein n=1 Tax=Puccinia striiformis f. sp. tritici TaxID=168172 RepID=A0ACC0DZI9_9BASI|nr:hypothetical protein MJO28_013440 [Puccinia striiformis f. sp. tritici]